MSTRRHTLSNDLIVKNSNSANCQITQAISYALTFMLWRLASSVHINSRIIPFLPLFQPASNVTAVLNFRDGH
jgi:hypothetical protein